MPLQITAEIIAGEEKCEKVCWASSTLFFMHLGPSFFFSFAEAGMVFYERRSEAGRLTEIM